MGLTCVVLHIRFLVVNLVVECLTRKILAKSNISSTGMSLHAFVTRDAGCNGTDGAVGLFGQLLVGEDFDEFSHIEAAGITCRPFGGQDVVCTGGLVPIGYGSAFAQKKRAVIFKIFKVPVQVLCNHLHMLCSIGIIDFSQFLAIFTKDHFAMILP